MPRLQFSRRSLLGSVGAASIAPALPAAVCDPAMQSADLPVAQPAFEGRLLTGPQQKISQSPARYTASILGGEFKGTLLAGAVQSGRIEWTVDQDSQAMHISAHYAVLRPDGQLVEVRDRSAHPQALRPASITRLHTAPEIVAGGEQQDFAPLLVGLLDASGFSSGQVVLRVFRVV